MQHNHEEAQWHAEVSEASETSEASDASEMSETSEAFEASETSGASEASETSDRHLHPFRGPSSCALALVGPLDHLLLFFFFCFP